MQLLRDAAEARAFAREHGTHGRRIAFVPTMGFLHAGHLALMETARAHAPVVVASIFVNPTQFGPTEDLSRYPRDEAGDLEKCRAAGCDAVFLPPVGVMYPPGHRTRVQVGQLTEPLCGASRPGHFDGVCTVVLKLFHLVGCDVAVCGEKDYQQLAVIRQMTRDLDLAVEIVGHPIVREADGLAMSSRNVFLNPEERAQAVCLSRAIATARAAWEAGLRDARALEDAAARVVAQASLADVDYLEVRDAVDLSSVGLAERDVLLAMAVRFGKTRLIDNGVFRV